MALPVVLFAAELPENRNIPGGVAIVSLPALPKDTKVQFQNSPIWVIKTKGGQKAIVGIPLTQTTGSTQLQIGNRTLDFSIEEHTYPESRIYLSEQKYVNPANEFLERIRTESQEIKKQFQVFNEDIQPRLPLSVPAKGVISSRFGLRRFFNDQPRKPHSGLDIAAPKGTPIRAPTKGKVLIIGDYHFNGKTIFIDHGQGLITMYCHLNEILVKPGQELNRGKKIGTIGNSGRVTGPHLHWAVNLNGHMVDPELFIALDE